MERDSVILQDMDQPPHATFLAELDGERARLAKQSSLLAVARGLLFIMALGVVVMLFAQPTSWLILSLFAFVGLFW